jgi:hypothetical protein
VHQRADQRHGFGLHSADHASHELLLGLAWRRAFLSRTVMAAQSDLVEFVHTLRQGLFDVRADKAHPHKHQRHPSISFDRHQRRRT